MVINHLDKLFVTSDAGTIVDELEVQHPAAKLLVLAGKAQQEEVGDGANLVITLAGELLEGAEALIRTGLHPSEIIGGYTKAAIKVHIFSCNLSNAAQVCIRCVRIVEVFRRKRNEGMLIKHDLFCGSIRHWNFSNRLWSQTQRLWMYATKNKWCSGYSHLWPANSMVKKKY